MPNTHSWASPLDKTEHVIENERGIETTKTKYITFKNWIM